MSYTSTPLIQWNIFKCCTDNTSEHRLIGWYKRSYISSALVSFDTSAYIFMCTDVNYFIPPENCGTNFTALFNFNRWLESQSFVSIEDVSNDFN